MGGVGRRGREGPTALWASAKALHTLLQQCVIRGFVPSFFCSPRTPVLISARTKGLIRLWCDGLVLVSPPEAVNSWSPSRTGVLQGPHREEGRAWGWESSADRNLWAQGDGDDKPSGCLAYDPLMLNPCRGALVSLPSTARTCSPCVLMVLGSVLE